VAPIQAERPAVAIPTRYNLASALLDRRLGAGAGHPAIEFEDRTWSCAELADLVGRAGSGFRSLGVLREQRILIVLPDSPEFIASFLGAMLIGAVAVPSSTFLGPSDYKYFLRQARPPLLVTTSELLERMELGDADVPQVLLVDAPSDDGRVRSWRQWIGSASPELSPADTNKDEPAFWLWTSGSTGEPKAVVHLHQDAPWCCRGVAEDVLGMTAADRVYSGAKLFHAYGLGNALFFPLWTGATTILNESRSTPDAVYSVITRTRPTIFFGVPTLFALLLRVPDAERRFDLSSLRFCVSAGEPLPAELYRRWLARFGTEILDGIGSTELLNMYICSRQGRVKPGSSGVVVPGYDVKIVDDAGEVVGVNETGDLLVRGPSCAVMYWNRRDQTKQKMRGEWFVSGDKYSVDEDGYYWYAGRSDDMFKASGEWISPTEIESLLAEHPVVVESAVVAWQESSGVLKPKAYVVLAADVAGTDELIVELQTFVRDRAAHYKCPRAIEFIDELPKTATGKVQRFKLRDLAARASRQA
jgi:benzoate-CoA ligase family protein